jgi:hypothetical protein
MVGQSGFRRKGRRKGSDADLGEGPHHANPQARARSWQRQSYQNVSRETLWYDWAGKIYKAQDNRAVLAWVRWNDFLVRSEDGGSGAPLAALVGGARPRCKFRTNDSATKVLRPTLGLIRCQRLTPVHGFQRRNDFAPEFCTERALENRCAATCAEFLKFCTSQRCVHFSRPAPRTWLRFRRRRP